MEGLRATYACLILLSITRLQSAQFMCNEGSPLGHDVNLTVNCHTQSLSPEVTYTVLDPDNTFPTITVRYSCNSTGDEVITVEGEVFDRVIDTSLTRTVDYNFTSGTNCIIFGCYITAIPMGRFSIPPQYCTIDIDECDPEIDTNDCDPNAVCNNTIGSFICHCIPGFEGNGTYCADIDECDPQIGTNDCDPNAVCNNTIGSFDCHCIPGFEGNGTYCTDIDECDPEIGTNDCDPNAVCNNTIGSFDCHCIPGFEGNGTYCADIDECDPEIGTNDCDLNAVCNNAIGSFDCHCIPGFEGNGTYCISIIREDCDNCTGNTTCEGATCACKTGLNCTGTKIDVDGCNRHNCHENAICLSTELGYNCTCLVGYKGDGFTCTASKGHTPASKPHWIAVWVAAVVLVSVGVIVGITVCIVYRARKRIATMREGKKPYLYLLRNTKWDEVDHTYNPVRVEVFQVYPSLISILEQLDTWSRCNSTELINKKSEALSDCASNGTNPRNSPITLRKEPKDEAICEHQCGIVHQDSCDVASVVCSMSEEKREDIQLESTSIIMSSDDSLSSQVDFDQTSTCVSSNHVGIADLEDGRGANTLPQHMRTPLCVASDCTGSSGYEGDYYTTAEICDSSNQSLRFNSVELCRRDLTSMCPTPNLDRGHIFLDSTPPTTHDTTGSSGYGSDYISTTELISDEACKQSDLPSMCPAPNLDRGHIFLDSTPPTTHDTTGSSGYGSDYISTTELISDEACKRSDLPSMCPAPNLDRGCDSTPPTTHDTTGSSGYGSDYISATELISDEACNSCYSQLHSNKDKVDLMLPFHGLDDHLRPETKEGSSTSYISVEELHERRREKRGDVTDTNDQYSQAKFFNTTQDMTGSSGYGSDYITAEDLDDPLAIETRQSEHATLQVPMATAYRELPIIREDYIIEAELFQNC